MSQFAWSCLFTKLIVVVAEEEILQRGGEGTLSTPYCGHSPIQAEEALRRYSTVKGDEQ